MNKYKIWTPCCKCWERWADTEYLNWWPDPSMLDVFWWPPDDFEPTPSMRRTCNNCWYIWLEEPIT